MKRKTDTDLSAEAQLGIACSRFAASRAVAPQRQGANRDIQRSISRGAGRLEGCANRERLARHYHGSYHFVIAAWIPKEAEWSAITSHSFTRAVLILGVKTDPSG